MISSWYMRRPVPEERFFDLQPRLYHKYVGHDNNRDFFTMAMKESSNINRQLYVDWLPQIVYNHHQSAPPARSFRARLTGIPSTTSSTRSS